MKTNKEITIKRSYSAIPGDIIVPKGAAVMKDRDNRFWICPSNFEGVLKHDATYYGFSVAECDIEFTKEVSK